MEKYILYNTNIYKYTYLQVDMIKSIKVSVETWKTLMKLKLEKNIRTLDELIKKLLENSNLIKEEVIKK